VLAIAGSWYGREQWLRTRAVGAPSATAVLEREGTADTVTLPESKRANVAVRTVSVEKHELHRTRQVPGRVRYDDTCHIEIKAAADGILTDVLVKPGDVVRAGQVLATLHSPEIGIARADVLKRKSELELADRAAQWQSQTHDNLQLLLAAIRKRESMKQLEEEFEAHPLGDHRATLFTAYSKLLLAEKSLANIQSAASSGAVSARTVLEQTNARESAEASLKASCEQSAFDARRLRDEAVAHAADAQRRLDLARQHVAALLGHTDSGSDEPVSVSRQNAGQIDAPRVLAKRGYDPDTRLSLFDCQAPFEGTIERKQFAALERVKAGDSLFVLADTRRLWIAADLREQDWDALQLTAGQELLVESPALGRRTLVARVQFVGREVSPDSNAVPLVAEIDNSDGLLRPGMFVRVTIALDQPSSVLAVPSAAVVEHEHHKFVFIPGSRDGEFLRKNITAGRDDGEWIEVLSGLELGTQVVAHGAFVLKSELLLERE
jgi:cobalt-zinc-cadmium efflux system membrane fusion protein